MSNLGKTTCWNSDRLDSVGSTREVGGADLLRSIKRNLKKKVGEYAIGTKYSIGQELDLINIFPLGRRYVRMNSWSLKNFTC